MEWERCPTWGRKTITTVIHHLHTTYSLGWSFNVPCPFAKLPMFQHWIEILFVNSFHPAAPAAILHWLVQKPTTSRPQYNSSATLTARFDCRSIMYHVSYHVSILMLVTTSVTRTLCVTQHLPKKTCLKIQWVKLHALKSNKHSRELTLGMILYPIPAGTLESIGRIWVEPFPGWVRFRVDPVSSAFCRVVNLALNHQSQTLVKHQYSDPAMAALFST